MTPPRSMAGLPWIAAMALFMQTLDATILNTALPAMAASLQRSPIAMQSAIISYTLTVALLIPISGWMADRFGTKRVFLSAVSLFVLGSLSCAVSANLSMLISSRILQGVGGAMMMPVARLALIRSYPREQLLPVLNFVTMPGLVGPVLGPLLGGWLVTYTSWHWIFLINLPIGLLGLWYAKRYMPDIRMPTHRLDWRGFLFFGLGLVLITLGMELFSEHALGRGIAYATLGSGILLLLSYGWHATHYPNPLIDLKLFRIRTFSIGIAGNMFSRLGTGGIPFLLPLMLQVGLGYSAEISGWMMAPVAAAAILSKPFITQLLQRLSYRTTLLLTTALTAACIAGIGLYRATYPIWVLIPLLLVFGMLMSIQLTSMNTLALSGLSEHNASGGNAVLSVAQQLAISFGIAGSASILSLYKEQGFALNLAFHHTFLTVAGITLLSGVIFMLMKPHDGANMHAPKSNPLVDE
ncbi:DHA2 family efflux MFS transporter permease subunit [Plesiomonas sp.]|uniref:DHA2 family efflux MFS transporter permease subunit n=1 Tax=Plesiomonas sp. TaxID=2486279 RepID=UPI003F3D7C61